MDINEYIASGIIENYVLGNVSAQEKKEVECMSHIYPEIAEELRKSELAMENYLQQFKKEVPKSVKEKLFEQIDSGEAEATNENTEAKVVSINTRETGNNFWKYASAASIALFLVSSTFVIMQKNKTAELHAEVKEIKESRKEDSIQLAENARQMKYAQSMISMYEDSRNRMIPLAAVKEKDPSSKVMICWNKDTKEVCIEVDKLPATPEGMQYQLWAIVDGKPVDLGVMNINDPTDKSFHIMKSVENPQAFAITLETKGGKPVPTLSEMYAIGNV